MRADGAGQRGSPAGRFLQLRVRDRAGCRAEAAEHFHSAACALLDGQGLTSNPTRQARTTPPPLGGHSKLPAGVSGHPPPQRCWPEWKRAGRAAYPGAPPEAPAVLWRCDAAGIACCSPRPASNDPARCTRTGSDMSCMLHLFQCLPAAKVLKTLSDRQSDSVMVPAASCSWLETT